MIKIFQDSEELNDFAAKKFVEIGDRAIETREKFTVALAGGSTPKTLYRLLSSDEFKDRIDWSKTIFFFGDERNVLPDDADSNYRMARENLFEPLQIKDANVCRWETELDDAEQTALVYDVSVGDFFCTSPRFDLILLGMGEDGHTASLFPFTEALNETKRNAVANPVKKLGAVRLTLTFPAINGARNVMFLVQGASKAAILREVLHGAPAPQRLPAQNVKPENGDLYWLVDRPAAVLLP